MKKLISIIMMLIICVSAFASCGGEDVSLQEAGTYLYNLYKDDAELTPSDYDVAGLIKIGELTYNVEWSVDVKEGVTIKESETNGFFTIDVDEKTEKEIAYVLTATIKNEDGDTVTKSFNRKIPAYKVFSYAEYAAAADDSTVVVKGIITGIISKSNGSSANGLYLQDTANEGGYYIYGIKDGKDPMTDLGLKLGMTVEATGLKDTYNGLYEIIDASIEVLDKTENKVTPVDYTEILKNAEKLSDEALVGKQSILVTIKGVEITGQVTASGYYNFKLGDLETYVRISSSNNCISKDEQTAFIKTHTDNFGYVADVTGIVQLYSGNFYLIPATAETFTNMALPERSDSEKLEMELGNITITDKVTEDTVVELPLTGATYPEVKFEWTSDNACAVIDADGKLTITLPEEDATVTITLKVTVGEVTETKTFEIKVDGAATDLYIPNKAETLEAGKAYKLAMWQAQLGKYLYFNGEMSGYYFGITDKANKAVDVYVEAVDGGYRFYILGENDAKMYLEIYKNGNYVNTKLSAEPSAVFVYDEEAKTYVVDIEGTKYYLGTYGTKEDLRCSATSYITGDNANKVGDSQHVAFFAKLANADYQHNKAEKLEADKAYKLAMWQAQLGKYLYFSGEMSGYYFGVTDKANKAVDVYVETVDGGYRFYILGENDAKMYLEIYKNGNYVNTKLSAEPSAVFVYDEEAKTYVVDIEGTKYYLGTYGTKEDLRCSATSYITGDNANKVGDSQHVAAFFTLEIKEVSVEKAETLAADTAYKFAMWQAQLGKYLYFNGEMSGYYFGVTDKRSKAADVYVETVDGGYRFYILGEEDAKMYLEIYKNGNYVNTKLSAEPSAVFVYDEEAKTYVVDIEGTKYYLGTYGTKEDLRCSATSYITGDNANKVGDSQHVAFFATIEFVK